MRNRIWIVISLLVGGCLSLGVKGLINSVKNLEPAHASSVARVSTWSLTPTEQIAGTGLDVAYQNVIRDVAVVASGEQQYYQIRFLIDRARGIAGAETLLSYEAHKQHNIPHDVAVVRSLSLWLTREEK